MEHKNLVGYWLNLARAYEIALLGNNTIQVVFNKDYKNGFHDYQLIKSFYKDVSFVAENGDIVVGITEPTLFSNIKFETIDIIHNRVEKARVNSIPETFNIKDDVDRLIKVYIERIGTPINRIDNIIKIASTIAQLGKSATIKTEHVGEAIQYNTYYEDIIINAEKNSIVFGKSIEIALTTIEDVDIDNAIEYLKKLKK
ncbi:MAG: Magnesium chelatase, subunit ChlI C-terminal [Bacteroidota bacterium]|jgi:hypothetical protein